MNKESIILVGGGGHCHSVIDVIEQEDRFIIAGIIDLPENIGKTVMGYKVIGCDDDIATLRKQYDYAVITTGQIKSSELRQKLFNQLKTENFALPVIISPFAYVAKSASIAEGTVIMHHSLVNANVTIGKCCIINTKSLVEHDAMVEDFCHVSTGAILNGNVTLTASSFFGSNATSKQGSVINEFIKAGSVAK